MNAPRHVRQSAYWVRTRVECRRDLLPSDKLVARMIAHAHYGYRTHAMSRERIAARCGLSVRTVQRAIGRLVRAGLLLIEERGRIEGGRRFRQVYQLLKLQVGRGDTLSPSSRAKRTTTTGQGGRDACRTRRGVPAPHVSYPLATGSTGRGDVPDAPIPVLSLIGGPPNGNSSTDRRSTT